MQLKTVDPNELINGLIKMLGRVIGEQIHIVLETKSYVKPILADVGQIEQVIMNLCINARDAMPHGGTLIIESKDICFDRDFCRINPWAKEGEYVCISVSDTGVGIAPAMMEHLFEPFFTTKEVGHGTGLGLATVYGIVEVHGGMIKVYSEIGKGSTFRIYLPVSPESVSVDEIVPEAPIVCGHETVLLAEDEELVRNLAVSILEEAGYRLLVAKDGEEAITILKEHAQQIDLALLDAVMPKKSGRQVHDAIREMNLEIPVVYMSGYSFATLSLEDLAGSGIPLIQKPYSARELLHRISECLRH